MQAMTPAVCRFNGHVGGTQTSAFIVFIDGARFDSLTPSAPSPGQGLKRTLHSSTNKLNKSRLVKQKKNKENLKKLKIGTRTHHHQCKRKQKQTNIPVAVVIQIKSVR